MAFDQEAFLLLEENILPNFTNSIISECNADLDKYKGKRELNRKKREVTGEDYIYGGTDAAELHWPWAVSIYTRSIYRKNSNLQIKGQ